MDYWTNPQRIQGDHLIENQEYIVKFAKYLFHENNKVLCRKCENAQPCLSPPGSLMKDLNGIQKEQMISGICSDACWDNCSEDEIVLYKFLYPYYLKKDCKRTTIHFCQCDNC